MRSAREALAFYKAKKTNGVGMCLWEVQNAFGSPHMYPNAIGQWRAAKRRHPGDRTPKIGAPGYFDSAQAVHGHIAIYKGDGMWVSSDAGGRGRMGTVSAAWFKRYWGMDYLGWSEDIGGELIEFGRDVIEVKVSKLKPGVDDSDSVRMLRLALIRRGFLRVRKPLSVDRPGNKYTVAVVEAVKLWQKKKGHKPTGVLNTAQAKQFFAPNKRVKVIPPK